MPALSFITWCTARPVRWICAGLLLALAGVAGAFDVDDGYAPELDDAVNALAVQPSGHGIVGGEFTSINGVSCARLCRLDAAGQVAAGFGPTGLNGDVFALLAEPDGSVTVGGAFTEGFGGVRARLLRLNADGSIADSAGAGVNGTARALARQPDGRLLIGGDFSQIGGSWPSRRIARQLASGSIDTSFLAEVDGSVLAIALLDDGRIVIGGTFANVSGVARQNLAVLRPNGQVDFNASFNANGAVRSITRDADGTLVIGGAFTQIDGIALSRLARMTPDGGSVYGLAAAEAGVRATLVHSDGQLILGGDFLAVDNQPRARLARLDQERQLESTWRAVTGGSVNAIAEQPDGSLLLGGSFTTANGEPRSRLARVNPQGQLERTLIADVDVGRTVRAAVEQADGGLLLGGNFNAIAGQARDRLARLRPDGQLDPTFSPSFSAGVPVTLNGLAALPDGALLVTGNFVSVNGIVRRGLARLDADGSVSSSFAVPSVLTGGPVSGVHASQGGRVYVTGTPLAPFSGIVRIHPDTGSIDSGFQVSGVRLGEAIRVIEQPDGRVLVLGPSRVNEVEHPRFLGRVLADGSPDPSFTAQTGESTIIRAAALQPDGRIMVAYTEQTSTSGFVRRLRADGGLENDFSAIANGPIRSIALSADGTLAIGGDFTTVNGQPRGGHALLSPSGSVLAGLATPTSGSVLGVQFLRDGKLLLNGDFSSVGARPRHGLARISTRVAALYRLDIHGRLFWSRGGTAPELTLPPRAFTGPIGGLLQPDLSFVRAPGGWQIDSLEAVDSGTTPLRLQVAGASPSSPVMGRFEREYVLSNPVVFRNGFEAGNPN